MTFVDCVRCKTRNSAFNPTCIACGAEIVEAGGPSPPRTTVRLTPPIRSSILRAGDRIGAFVLAETIASGNTGSVHRARVEATGETVALKLLHSHLVGSGEARARFLREAHALTRVQHPNVGAIRQVIDEPPFLALVLEHLEGESLEARLLRGPLPEAEARRVVAEVAEGVSALHRAELVHRDVKPANVILAARDGQATLVDLGLVRTLESRPGTMKTASGVLLGSLAYSAPELVMGKPATKASDLWSLGVVLFEAVTGRRPFEAPSRFALASAILSEDPSFDLLPASLRPLVRELLARDQSDRARPASEVAISLRARDQG